MRVSLRIVEKLVGFKLPGVHELVDKVNSQLGGVEEVIDLGAKYGDARVVRVISSEKHPNADRLSVCLVDDGGLVSGVDRDENGLVQVVCGAPNARSGMWAVWLPPESIVPATFDDAEPFKLGARELRGVMSHGMLAAGDELGINNDHEGIIEITDYDLPEGGSLVAGASFAEVFGLDGHVIDIENKMFTHRPDCFGQLGVAREISAILQPDQPTDEYADNHFVNPEWFHMRPEFDPAEGLELEAFNDVVEKAPRFMAVALKNIKVDPSPLWLQCQLVAMGSKPVNNIVDLTNYIMLITAQPAHAYDYDKLRGHKLGVRMAKDGEKAELLNGKTYTLTTNDIVISDAERIVGLGGVMGSLDSEVTAETKNIVLEVANFDMYSIRKTSMRHGLFTDAVTRFNKGQSPLQNGYVMKRLLELMPGEQASPVYDLPDKTGRLDEVSIHGEIRVGVNFINNRLGTDFTSQQIGNILREANFFSYPDEEDPGTLVIVASFWRTDIEIPEDIVEEVGRLYGFDRLPRQLPVRDSKPVRKNPTRELKHEIRDSMKRLGANEVLSYSFVHENVLTKSGQEPKSAFKLANALSPDLQYYRLSVLPSLLDKVHMNIKAGHDEFILYEIGKGHNKTSPGIEGAGLPEEYTLVDMVYSSKKPAPGSAYYRLKRAVDQLFNDLGVEVMYQPVVEEVSSSLTAPFEVSRSATVWTADRKLLLGTIGELKQDVLRGFKLPEYTAASSFSLEQIEEAVDCIDKDYRPLSRYPSVIQDISLVVATSQSYVSVLEKVNKITSTENLLVDISPISIYQADESDKKTITLRLVFTSHEKTLSDKDVAPIMQNIEHLVQK